jgi:hypothetical protein
MSRENVETFRRAIDAFNARSVKGMMSVLDRDAEFRPMIAGVTDTPYRGEEGVRKFLAATDEGFEQLHLHCERVEDHGAAYERRGRIRTLVGPKRPETVCETHVDGGQRRPV